MWAGHGAWGAWPIQQAAFANIPSEEGTMCDFNADVCLCW